LIRPINKYIASNESEPRFASHVPLPGEHGSCQTVKARLWHWLSGKSPLTLFGCYLFARQRSKLSLLWRIWGFESPQVSVRSNVHCQGSGRAVRHIAGPRALVLSQPLRARRSGETGIFRASADEVVPHAHHINSRIVLAINPHEAALEVRVTFLLIDLGTRFFCRQIGTLVSSPASLSDEYVCKMLGLANYYTPGS
jgi:hypothetical protein